MLEAARRALNVVFDVSNGRSFLRRKLVDVGSTIVLMVLILVCLVLAFIGGGLAEDLLGYHRPRRGRLAALEPCCAGPRPCWSRWSCSRYVYYVTPDVQHRAFHWITPGAVVAVLLWLAASYALSLYLSRVADVGAIYGAFASPIVLVGWLWLTNVALLFGAELNAEIERQKELAEGVPLRRHPQPPRARRLAGRRFNK